jgi:hypothetical protein
MGNRIILQSKTDSNLMESCKFPTALEEYIDCPVNTHHSLDDKTILIIEDDPSFASFTQVAHNNGFKAIIAHQG